jgi:hypothetical protein
MINIQPLTSSIELAHVQLVGIGSLDDHIPVEDILELQLIEPA